MNAKPPTATPVPDDPAPSPPLPSGATAPGLAGDRMTTAPGHEGPAGRESPVGPARPVAPPSLGRRLVAPLGALVGVGAAFAYVGAVDPNEPGHYPVCPLLRFTGLYCPGCGGLRSAHAFITGEFGAAVGANALAVVGYGLFAVVMTVWLVRVVRGVPMRFVISSAWWWVIGAVLAAFTLVRNLPFGSALAP